MKRKIAILIIIFVSAVCAALGFSACLNLRGNEGSTKIIYHLNGGVPVNFYQEITCDTVEDTVSAQRKEYYDQIEVKKETWIFDGWYTDAACKYQFNAFPAQNVEEIDLYAKWTDKITVNSDNFATYFSVHAQWNGALTIPWAAVDFYLQPKAQWLIDPLRSGGEIQLTASPQLGGWSGRDYAITLSAENDFSYSNRVYIDREIEFQIGSASLDYTITSQETELYLLHKAPVSVTLETDGGIFVGTEQGNILEVNAGDTVSANRLPTPVKAGYRFEKWCADEALTVEFESKVITRPIKIYAKWNKEVVITFETLGGSFKQPHTYLANELLQLGDEPTKQGLGFAGWYLDVNYKRKFTETAATQSVTLYARWEPFRKINFDMHGAEDRQGFEVLNTTVLDGQLLGEEPWRNGFVFGGWYTDGGYLNKYNGEPILQDTTLHALWCYQYSGLMYDQANENINAFFTYGVSFERKQVTENGVNRNKLFVRINLKLKEEYQKFYFILNLSVTVNFYNAEIQFIGNGRKVVWISTLSDVESQFEMEYDSFNDNNIYFNTDSVKLTFYGSWCDIRFPEGYAVEGEEVA